MYDYPYGYMPSVEADLDGMIGAFVAIYLVVMFFIFAFSVVCYIFHSIGLYSIAKRRGIHNPWLAWIPVGSLWVLGSISDQYQYVAKGKVKNRRKILLGLQIAYFALYGIFAFVAIIAALLGGELAGAVMVVLVGVLAFLAAILMVVYQYISLYDLFRSSQPEDAVLFLVLSIFFSVALPFFIFACRKKDLGMPPRKKPVTPVIIEPVTEITEEPAPEAEGYAQPEEFEEE